MTRPIATHMGNPVGQAYQILHVTYVLVPVVAGLDKFFHLLVPWTQYLAPLFISLLPIPPETFMRGVGIFEIIVGITVAVKPHYGGYLAAIWLWGIILNLLLYGAWYEVALRDFGLSLGALALARLSEQFD